MADPTIRETLSKRVRRLMFVAFAGWAICAASMLLMEPAEKGTPPLFILGFIVFGGVVLATLFLIRCPRCGYRLQQQAVQLSPFPFQSEKQRVNFCPHCGVNFDEPLFPKSMSGAER